MHILMNIVRSADYIALHFTDIAVPVADIANI
jgi:hypothetical protein